MNKHNFGYLVLATLAIVGIAGFIMLPPIEQKLAYHNFCDSQTCYGIPNFWNVVSNLPFLLVGILGLWNVKKMTAPKLQFFLFFLSIALVAFGSAYYHLNPNNSTLVWDRLPMAIAFMTLFSIVIGDHIGSFYSQRIFIPAVLIGLVSVLYWHLFDDLRPYLLVQFYPMLAIPVLLFFFKSKYNLSVGYWLLLLTYILAKLVEYYDCQTWEVLGIISGHPLKHIFASAGLFILLFTFVKRRIRH